MNTYKIKAPQITAQELWEMSPDNFNSWRREFDYPRIIAFFKENLTYFIDWLEEPFVEEQLLIDFGPALFLKENNDIKIYSLKFKDGRYETKVIGDDYSIGDIIFDNVCIIDKKIVVPFLKWVKSFDKIVDEKISQQFHMCSHSRINRSVFLFDKLELVDVGNVKLSSFYSVGKRELQFLNLDDLIFDNVNVSSIIQLWYCSAINLKIIGDFNRIDAYKTMFSDFLGTRARALKLLDGNYQKWTFKDCNLDFKATNSNIFKWKVEGNQFQCSLEHSDLESCQFIESESKSKDSNTGASRFHRKIKLLYSRVGDNLKAGQHFYKEKQFEQKSLLRPQYHYFDKVRSEKNTFKKWGIYFCSYLKSLNLLFQNLLWGFGEKPVRVFIWATFVIIMSAFLFYYHPLSKTHDNIVNSFYFSVVSFTTLGYGEITQNNTFLKLYAALEALIGLSIMALAVAGFSSKSKDY